jgi:hypothetical protein
LKSLIFGSLLALSIVSCKKEQSKTSTTTEVTYTFNPDGQSSDIYIQNFTTGKIQTFTSQSSSLSIKDNIIKGDRVLLKMTGIADGLDNAYNIRIYLNGKPIHAVRALGAAGKRQQNLVIEHIFSEVDFQ